MAKKPQNGLILYYCITYYQVLIAMAKALLDTEQLSDIALSDAIPDVVNLNEKVKESAIFSNTYILQEKDYVKIRRAAFKEKYNSLPKSLQFLSGKILWINAQKDIVEYMTGKVPFDCMLYANIFVFGEGRGFAPYLHSRHIKFVLVEDAIDYFKHRKCNDLIEQNRMSKPRKNYYLNSLLDLLHFYYYMGGYSHSVKAIEVNNTDNLVFEKSASKKTYAVNRSNLFASLSKVEKNLIFTAFAGAVEIDTHYTESSAIIFSNPLLYDKQVQSEAEALDVYRRFIKDFCNGIQTIYFKPHPRDVVNYEQKLKTYTGKDVVVLYKNMPSEILSFMDNFNVHYAFAISSTAVEQATFAKECKNIGMDYLNKFKC